MKSIEIENYIIANNITLALENNDDDGKNIKDKFFTKSDIDEISSFLTYETTSFINKHFKQIDFDNKNLQHISSRLITKKAAYVKVTKLVTLVHTIIFKANQKILAFGWFYRKNSQIALYTILLLNVKDKVYHYELHHNFDKVQLKSVDGLLHSVNELLNKTKKHILTAVSEKLFSEIDSNISKYEIVNEETLSEYYESNKEYISEMKFYVEFDEIYYLKGDWPICIFKVHVKNSRSNLFFDSFIKKFPYEYNIKDIQTKTYIFSFAPSNDEYSMDIGVEIPNHIDMDDRTSVHNFILDTKYKLYNFLLRTEQYSLYYRQSI